MCQPRCRDIAELTQQVNQLEHQLNQWSDENEALRGRLGVGLEEEVDLRGLRQRKKSELEQLRADNRMLEREVRGDTMCTGMTAVQWTPL